MITINRWSVHAPWQPGSQDLLCKLGLINCTNLVFFVSVSPTLYGITWCVDEPVWTTYCIQCQIKTQRDWRDWGSPSTKKQWNSKIYIYHSGSHMGTRGFQEEARSTATELERCRRERSQENGHQLGRGWRGCRGQEELEESCRPMRLRRGMNRKPGS